MIEEIALFVGDVLGYRINARFSSWQERNRIRRTLRAHSAGQTVAFPGWALGEAAYCRRSPEGFLIVEADGRVYTCVAPDLPPTRRRVPVERIRIVATFEAAQAVGVRLPPDWQVTDCLDEDVPVRFACHRDEMPLLLSALSSPSR